MRPIDEISMAAAAGDTALVRSLLQANHRLASAQDETGATPLHYAASAGAMATTVLLLDRGADASIQTGTGVLPERIAVQRGHPEVARLLGLVRLAQERGQRLQPGHSWGEALAVLRQTPAAGGESFTAESVHGSLTVLPTKVVVRPRGLLGSGATQEIFLDQISSVKLHRARNPLIPYSNGSIEVSHTGAPWSQVSLEFARRNQLDFERAVELINLYRYQRR